MRLFASAILALLLTSPVQAQESLRTQQLEEQVRQLTGRVEELSFQLLQMEERMRKMQEDNEFRFQELEDAGEPQKTDAPAPEGGEAPGKPDAARAAAKEKLKAPTRLAQKPAPTLQFDDEGKLLAGPGGSDPKQPDVMDVLKPFETPFDSPSEAAFAAAAFGSTPDAVFARGRELYRSGTYEEAAKAFRAHIGAWPEDGRKAQARYWLGQSLFKSGKFYDSASALLDAFNGDREAETAPDALLTLGLSLAGLEQREAACATYAEVLKQYPQAETRLGEQVRVEQEAARC